MKVIQFNYQGKVLEKNLVNINNTASCILLYITVAESVHLSATIPADLAGKRLDQALAILFPNHSRARIQNWIRTGDIRLNNQKTSQKYLVRSGDMVEINTIFETNEAWIAEEIPLAIVYEDEQILIINKPAGLVVHPGAGNPDHTLLNALLHHDPGLNNVPRAGIVQRLDKDTSGIMVIARTPESHTRLVTALQKRNITREYQAIVRGILTAGGTIDQPIGRHPVKRVQMAVVSTGKPAITHYRIIKKYRSHTHIRVFLETGRTHQIRVHMSWIKHPVVGDPVYSGRVQLPKAGHLNLYNALKSFRRQALHASAISLQHPESGKELRFEAPLPDDMSNLIIALEEDAKENT